MASWGAPSGSYLIELSASPKRCTVSSLAWEVQGPGQGISRSRVWSLASSVALGPLLVAQWYILGVLLG